MLIIEFELTNKRAKWLACYNPKTTGIISTGPGGDL